MNYSLRYASNTMNIKALFCLALALVAFVPAVSASPLSADQARTIAVSGNITEMEKFSVTIQGNSWTVITGSQIDPAGEKFNVLFFGLTEATVYGSVSGRILRVEGSAFKSCSTALKDTRLSGRVTSKAEPLANSKNLVLVTLSTSKDKLYTITRSRDLSAPTVAAQDLADNVFFNAKGDFYDQTPYFVDMTKNPPFINTTIKAISTYCP